MTTTKKQATRSAKRPGTLKTKALPYGSGSIQKRGRVFWLVYRDANGRMIQQSSGTQDAVIARRMIAERAIVTLQARIDALRAIINEATQTTAPAAEGAGDARNGRKHGVSRRSVRSYVEGLRSGATAQGGTR